MVDNGCDLKTIIKNFKKTIIKNFKNQDFFFPETYFIISTTANKSLTVLQRSLDCLTHASINNVVSTFYPNQGRGLSICISLTTHVGCYALHIQEN